ncbi:MAG: nucleotide sugar dehydrogenase [Candidatus Bathyarchaeia archaeon]
MLTTTDQKTSENWNAERIGKTTVSIVGCERIGILHACLFAEAGFRVSCIDGDRATIERVSKGKVPFLYREIEPIFKKRLETGKIQVSCCLEDAAKNEIIVVAVPAKLDERGGVDYSNIERTLRRIGSHIRKGTLIINTSVVGVGVTEGVLREALENTSGLKTGEDFYFAYCPVPFPERQTLKSLANHRRIVAAQDMQSLEKASDVMGTITKAGLAKSLNFKAAEAAVLLETIYRNVYSALMGELTAFCEKIGIDYFDVQRLMLANIDASHYLALNDIVGEEAFLMLFEEAENQNVKLKISRTAVEQSEEMVKRKIGLIQDALKSCGKAMRRAKIAVLGVSQTRDTADTPKKSLKNFVEILERRGAKPSFYDPYLRHETADFESHSIKGSLAEVVEGADCVVIYTGHEQFRRLNLRKIKLLVNMPAALVDFEGILEPAKVETEGFIYRGLGRGTWRK